MIHLKRKIKKAAKDGGSGYGCSLIVWLPVHLTFLATIGKRAWPGQGAVSLSKCYSMCNHYVAYKGNYRVQVFTAMGKFLRMFGGYGMGIGGN